MQILLYYCIYYCIRIKLYFVKSIFTSCLKGKSIPYDIFTIIWNLSPALINSLYVIVSWTLTDLQFKYHKF